MAKSIVPKVYIILLNIYLFMTLNTRHILIHNNFCYATGNKAFSEKTINTLIKAGEIIYLLLIIIYIKNTIKNVLNCIEKNTKT